MCFGSIKYANVKLIYSKRRYMGSFYFEKKGEQKAGAAVLDAPAYDVLIDVEIVSAEHVVMRRRPILANGTPWPPPSRG